VVRRVVLEPRPQVKAQTPFGGGCVVLLFILLLSIYTIVEVVL